MATATLNGAVESGVSAGTNVANAVFISSKSSPAETDSEVVAA